jgi:hypothetical protein
VNGREWPVSYVCSGSCRIFYAGRSCTGPQANGSSYKTDDSIHSLQFLISVDCEKRLTDVVVRIQVDTLLLDSRDSFHIIN